MKKLFKSAIKKANRALVKAKALNNCKGEGFIDVLVKMLIVVVIGALLLGILNAAIPDLFSSMIAKIKSTFGI